ncbi:hypothetical protein TrLO_g1504 [Triparma laevis f. longispina]|nr:hypothetical protein TrLO_g1504 [Triparma laevis f. longispina]
MNSKEFESARRFSLAGYGGKSKKFITSGEHLEEAGLDLEMGTLKGGGKGKGASGGGGATTASTITTTKSNNKL